MDYLLCAGNSHYRELVRAEIKNRNSNKNKYG